MATITSANKRVPVGECGVSLAWLQAFAETLSHEGQEAEDLPTAGVIAKLTSVACECGHTHTHSIAHLAYPLACTLHKLRCVCVLCVCVCVVRVCRNAGTLRFTVNTCTTPAPEFPHTAATQQPASNATPEPGQAPSQAAAAGARVSANGAGTPQTAAVTSSTVAERRELHVRLFDLIPAQWTGKPHYYIIHAWQGNCLACIQAVIARLVQQNGGMQTPDFMEGTYIWVDWIAIVQQVRTHVRAYAVQDRQYMKIHNETMQYNAAQQMTPCTGARDNHAAVHRLQLMQHEFHAAALRQMLHVCVCVCKRTGMEPFLWLHVTKLTLQHQPHPSDVGTAHATGRCGRHARRADKMVRGARTHTHKKKTAACRTEVRLAKTWRTSGSSFM